MGKIVKRILSGARQSCRLVIVTSLINFMIFPVQSFYVNIFNGFLTTEESTLNLYAEEGYSETSGTIIVDNTKEGSGGVTASMAAQSLQLETGTISVSDTWTTVTLNITYDSPVVICVANYNDNSIPVLTRVRNAAGNSFEIKLQNPSGSAVAAETVHYLVVEEGVWQLPDGRNIEAVKIVSDGVNSKGLYDNNLMELYTYQQSYTSPVVLGQVMTENDANWSVFWSSDGTYNDPPDASTCYVGKHVGEDSNTTRANETLGLVVIEAGSGTIEGVPYEAALGNDIIKGIDNGPPFTYTLSGFSAVPEIGIVCQTAMDGSDGAWVYMYGASPLSATSMDLCADEDQLNDSERKHTSEQGAYIVFESSIIFAASTPPVAIDDSYQVDQDTTLNVAAPGVLGNDTDAESDPLTAILVSDVANGTLTLNSDGSFSYTPNAGYTGMDTFTYKANDGTSDSNDATVTITVIPDVVSGLQLESGTVSIGDTWTTIILNNTYASPVVVCIVNYNNNTAAVVPRVRNASGNSFEARLQGTPTTPVADTIHYLVIEEGAWQLPDGRNIEAAKVISDGVNHEDNFEDQTVMESYAYQQGYTLPVVLGQVMTENDADWSVFWSCNATELDPPDATTCNVGKHVGEDPDRTRADETLGVIVIEAGSGSIDGTPYETAVGAETIKGIDSTPSPPYLYTLNNFSATPQVGIACQTAMDGINGGWTYLYGASSLSSTSIGLAIDEDQIVDSERKHTAENVAYIVFESPVVISSTTPQEPPVANNDSYQVDEETTLNVSAPGVLGNDTDANNDALTAILVTDAANGTLTLNSDGSFSYTPNAGYTGSDSFTYKANDGTDDSNNAIVTITVIDVPEAPTANDDNYNVDQDTTLNVGAPGVLGNDTDPENDPLTAILVTDVANGTLTLNSDGSFSYTPDAGYTGSDSFTYKANDGGLDSNDAIVTITVIDIPEAPTANDDSYNVDQDTTLNVSAPGVLGNDTDPENDPLTAILVTDVANGTLTLNSDGSFTYIPNAGYTGIDSFTYKANDGTADSNNATVTITVSDVQYPPVANDDSYQVNQDTTLNIAAPGVLGNDTDPENDPLTAILVTDVANGILTLNSDGSFDYTPNAGYVGADSFTYKANDGTADSNNATVTITVNSIAVEIRMETGTEIIGGNWTTINLANTYSSPVVVCVINYNNSSIPVVPRVRNAAGNTFEAMLQNPSGSAVVPETVHFIVIEEGVWQLPDGRNIEAVKMISDGVNDDVNWASSLMEQYTYQQSYAAPVILGQVMTANDTDWSVFWTCGINYDEPPDAATCYVGKHVGEDPNTTRADETLGFIVIESGNGFINGIPYETAVGPATVLAFDNPTPPPFVYTLSSFSTAPEIGIVCQNGMNAVNGSWAYLYGADPIRSAEMDLVVDEDQVADSERRHSAEQIAYLVFQSSIAIGNITNQVPPVANDDSFQMNQDTTLNVSAPGVLDNDADLNNDPLTAILVSDAANGSLTLNANGSFTYTPNAGYTGPDSFTYKANDGIDDSNTVTVSILVLSTSGPALIGQWDFNNAGDLTAATVGNDLALVGSDEAVTGYAPGDGAVKIGFASHYIANHGIAANGGGLLVNEYTIVFDIYCLAKYEILYKSLYQTSANNANDCEVKVFDFRKVGMPAMGGTTSEVLDLEKWYRIVITIDNGTDRSIYINGVLRMDGDEGTIDDRYALEPDVLLMADDDGNDCPILVSMVQLYDGVLDATSIAALGAPPVGPMPPVAFDDTYAFDEDVTLNVTAPGVLENDKDINVDILSAILVSDVNNGALTLNSDGSFNYVPNSGFSGQDSFTYKVNDGSLDSNTATVNITVRSTDPDPSYNVYYGDIHNHSTLSDGSVSASTAYQYARDTVGYDFFSLADHALHLSRIPNSWDTMMNTANSYNDDGNFVALWGFEYTRDDYGHLAVLNSPDFILGDYYNHFYELVLWLETQPDNVVAYFNHPGYADPNREFMRFACPPTDKIVGIELWNGSPNFYRFYGNGYYSNDGDKNYYDEALDRGWYIGASGAHDCHSAYFGSTSGRQAVLSEALTRVQIIDAMKQRRFFSTADRNLQMSFTIKGQQMGSRISAGTYNCVINANDGSENFTKIELYKNGDVFTTWTPGSSNPQVSQQITTAVGDYYYVKVTESDGDEAISSPIFIDAH